MKFNNILYISEFKVIYLILAVFEDFWGASSMLIGLSH